MILFGICLVKQYSSLMMISTTYTFLHQLIFVFLFGFLCELDHPSNQWCCSANNKIISNQLYFRSDKFTFSFFGPLSFIMTPIDDLRLIL